MSADEAGEITRRMQRGAFDFNDFLYQSRAVRNMGGMSGVLKLIPGIHLLCFYFFVRADTIGIFEGLMCTSLWIACISLIPNIVFSYFFLLIICCSYTHINLYIYCAENGRNSGLAGKVGEDQLFEAEKRQRLSESIVAAMTEEERANPDLVVRMVHDYYATYTTLCYIILVYVRIYMTVFFCMRYIQYISNIAVAG